MTKIAASRPSDLKHENRAAILRYVYDRDVFTKPDIYNYLQISKPTVSLLIDELVTEGVLSIVGRGNSTTLGGKRPLLYTLNAKIGFVIALHIGVDRLSAALMDLRLNVQVQSDQPFPREHVTSGMQQLISVVKQLTEQASALEIPVFGIGISAPGVVESQKGILLNPINLEGWTGLPLASELITHFSLPVWVDNESRNVAMAEKWFGIGKSLDTFITVQTRDGIGTGIVHNGTTYRGLDFSAGEFGHTTIDVNGPTCRCGNNGCWELYASELALLASTASIHSSNSDALHNNSLHQGNDAKMLMLGNLYLQRDPHTVALVDLYAQRLAVGLVNLVNAFNPEAIILHGNLFAFGQPFLDRLNSMVQRSALHPAARRVKIQCTDFLHEAALVGAASLVIREIVEGRLIWNRP